MIFGYKTSFFLKTLTSIIHRFNMARRYIDGGHDMGMRENDVTLGIPWRTSGLPGAVMMGG